MFLWEQPFARGGCTGCISQQCPLNGRGWQWLSGVTWMFWRVSHSCHRPPVFSWEAPAFTCSSPYCCWMALPGIAKGPGHSCGHRGGENTPATTPGEVAGAASPTTTALHLLALLLCCPEHCAKRRAALCTAKLIIPQLGQEKGWWAGVVVGVRGADGANFWVLGCIFHFCLATDFSRNLQQFSVSEAASSCWNRPTLASVGSDAAPQCHKSCRNSAVLIAGPRGNPALLGNAETSARLALKKQPESGTDQRRVS